ncbi:MAG: glycosyl hydrolase 43 family protein, partial [Bacteroidaceae bacterium]|nr:glycosyl hydrolase 43 family protein [Bacteroidaceae bacterium]
ADIIDIDEAYYNNKTVVSHGNQAKPEEGCAYACRDWYEEYAQSNLPRVDYENLYSADNMTLMGKYNNPIVNGDFPDCDPIRVGDWYYLASTTFTAFPGATILKSRDLVNWQYCANPLQQISNSDPYKLLNGLNHYSKGQWAPSLNYYNGKFYLNFIAYNHETVNDGGDFMLSTDDPEGTWQMQKVDGFYYDSGFLFDNDGKVYVAHGINNITVSQVDPNAAFKTVTEKTVINAGDKGLEGCHFYHIGDYYYIYATYNTELSQTIFRSTNPLGPYEEHSGRVFEGQRIHQGGLVETQTGEWWTILFKDAGSIGRVPYLEPVTWTDGWPVIGKAGVDVSKGGSSYNKPNVGKAWPRAYLETNDAFCDPLLGKQWQWNHLPDNGSWSLMERPGFLRLHTASVADNIRQARNSLTQRILGYAKEGATKTPDSYGTIRMDVSGMADGDRAGLSVFQKEWASIGVEQTDGKRYFVYRNSDGTETKGDLVNADVIYLRAIANYSTNKAKMYFSTDNTTFTQLGGELDMTFSLEVFMGNRFYIYNYATEALGGYVDVDWFSTETDYTEEKFYAPGTLHTFTEDELTAVEVSTPATQTIVMTGKAEEISVMATFKDGSVKNVAANCKYKVANDNILSIENGNVRGLMDGETDVTAIYTDMLGNEFRVTLPVKVSTFPLLSKYIDARLFGDGSFNDETSTLKTTQYGCGGWVYPNGIDLSPYKYVVIKFAKSIISGCQFHIYDVNNYWASAADVSLSTSTTQKISLANRQKSNNGGPLDLTHIYIFGIWSPSATSFQINDMFLSNDGKTPVAIEGIPADEDITIDSEQMFDLQGRRITRPAQHGIYIMGGRKILK